ncbi:FecR family protein [Halalkalibaculum sp. DA3122]|uniref:FecR family protein n=1 Tax=unclassified Halalkalibaculum TaxID=2964617 RepID=UPI003754469B
MMNKELLQKYISNRCSVREEELVKEWLNASSENKKIMKEMEQIWRVSPGKNIDVDSGKAWDAFRREHILDRESAVSDNGVPGTGQVNRHYLRENRAGRRSRVLAYVGTVAAVLLVALLFYNSGPFPPELPQQELVSQEITTEKGQRTMVRLSDGTRIHLNAESKLTVPHDYMKNERVVRLHGEAFFEVVSDQNRPFVVFTANSVTHVLGTKFNITAYSGDEEVQVVVAEGKVALGSDDDLRAPEVQLTRNQKGMINKNGEILASNIPDVSMYTDWSRGILTFRDAPLGEVEKKLERWYDVEVLFDEGISDEKRQLTGTFKDVSMSSVLNSIALSLELHYTQDGRTITFKAK